MKELIDLLVSDADMLPCEAAEKISIRRVAARESDRTAKELMIPIPTIEVNKTIQDAAAKLVETNSSILAVTTSDGDMVGVVTEWDVTRSTALGNPDDQPLNQVMSKQVISALPDDTILELIQKLEYHDISALPVVQKGFVQGVVTSDLLARQSLLRLLQTPV